MKLSRNMAIAVLAIIILIAVVFVAVYPAGQMKLEAVAKDRPDMSVVFLEYNPSEPETGDAITFTGEIKNNGEMPAENISIKIDFGNGNQDSTLVDALASGESSDFSFTETYLLSGIYTATVTADSENDADPGNNERSVTFSTSSQNESFDVAINDITWLPTHPSIGEEILFTIHIQNIGNAASQAADAVFDSGAGVHNFFVPELLPGQSGVEEAVFVYSVQGEYNAYAEVFADDINIYNNFRNETFTVSMDAYPLTDASHSPQNNITTYTQVYVTATGSDDLGLLSIEIFVDSLLRKTCDVQGTQGSCMYNSTHASGTHVYYSRVTDSVYHDTTSPARNFTVQGNVTDAAPVANISLEPQQPLQSQPITIKASASDNTDIKKIEIYIDDVLIATCRYPGTETYGECIYSAVFPSGAHQIYSEITDNMDTIVLSDVIEFSVV